MIVYIPGDDLKRLTFSTIPDGREKLDKLQILATQCLSESH
jgi:hypothetical protein